MLIWFDRKFMARKNWGLGLKIPDRVTYYKFHFITIQTNLVMVLLMI